MNGVLQDIRLALRRAARRRLATGVVVVTLASGMAASLAVFAVADALSWRPLPFRDASHVVSLWSYSPERKRTSRGVRRQALDAWVGKDEVFASVHMYGMTAATLSGVGDAEALTAGAVSAGLFAELGVRPRVGRELVASDFLAGQEPVVILSDSLWRGRFGSGDVLGRKVLLDERPHVIIGVMPRGFTFPVDNVRCWVGLTGDFGQAVARLKPRVSLPQAQAVAETATRHLTDTRGRALPGLRAMPFVSLHPRTQLTIRALLAAALLLLSIAVGNAANVLLAEGARRDAEMAIRTSLGVSAWRLTRQMLVEALVLSSVAAAVAIVLAAGALRWIGAALPWMLTYQTLRPLELGGRAVAFACLLAALAATATSLAPVLRARRGTAWTGMAETKAVGAGNTRLRAALLVAQIAFAFVLLVGAGLLTKGLRRLSRIDPGFRSDGLLTVSLELSLPRYREKVHADAFLAELRARASALPGVVRATVSDSVPPQLGRRQATIETSDGRTPEAADALVSVAAVDPSFFSTLAVSLRQGRHFEEADRTGAAPVAIVGAGTAARLWPAGAVVGQRFRLSPREPWLTVVGVAADVRHGAFDQPREDLLIYTPRAQSVEPPGSAVLALRTATDPMTQAMAVRGLARTLDPAVPISEIATGEELLAQSSGRLRFMTGFASSVAVVALILALAGTYGVFACAVAERIGEMAIRVVLGATPTDITREILRSSGRVAAAGVVVGVGLSVSVMPALRSVLFQTAPTDSLTYVVIGAGLILAAMAATYSLAARAGRLAPAEMLRRVDFK